MEADFVKLLRTTRLTYSAVRSLATRLPASDEDLSRLTASLVTSADEAAATALMLAMVTSGRTIKAELLPGVLPLMRDLDGVAALALRASGDVPETLLKTVESGIMGWEREAVLLLIAGWLCRHWETDLPPNLIPRARLLARDVGERLEALLPLFALAHITQNKGLQAVLEELVQPPPPKAIETTIEFLIHKPIDDPLGFLPEQMGRVISGNGPLRRAVIKVGRNEPCPCGSGKKYKKCCFEKDQERLHHSSEVAGVTTDELEVKPEPFLTRERLEEMRGPKLARLRIELVPPPLQKFLLAQLALFQLYDALLTAWEKVEWRDDLRVVYENCLFEVAHGGNRDVLIRLMAVRGITPEHDALGITGKLLLARDNPERYLALIEAAARRHLQDEKDLDYVDLACALSEGNLPGLGTLVARGAASAAAPHDAEMLFEHIGKVRDRLDLPPEDPGEWILDRLFDLPDELDDRTHEELAAARRQMAATAAEATRLRTQLAETRAQLERQERLTARNKVTPLAQIPTTTATETSPAELRKRMDELKSALKERHNERNTLRRELNEALKETAVLRELKSRSDPDRPANNERDREDQALLAEETTALQPFRMPVFPNRFSQTLASFPEHVARNVMILMGQLAAGEPAAFVGMRRLRIRHEICRVRVARDYRLLFKLQSDRLEIVDLINRRDFEKWLKTLG
jgi:hypothetical protein